MNRRDFLRGAATLPVAATSIGAAATAGPSFAYLRGISMPLSADFGSIILGSEWIDGKPALAGGSVLPSGFADAVALLPEPATAPLSIDAPGWSGWSPEPQALVI